MVKQQQTIKRPVSFSGIGIHTGSNVNMMWKPAPVDHGIKFVRVDLDGKPVIEPLIANIRDVTRWTTIGSNGTVIHTVEHVLATLNGYGIDNLIIELDANEPPVGDGSSLPFVQMVKQAGIQPQEGKREIFCPQETVHIEVGESLAVVVPSDELRISCTIHYGKPGLDAQFLSLAIEPETFETQISPARTFAFYEDLQHLIDHGLIKGGSLENAVLIRNESFLSTEPLRFRDEFVRHKILDVLGDIVLLGRPLAAHIITIRPGHTCNAELTKALARLMEKEEPAPVSFAPPIQTQAPTEQVMDIMQLLNVLPHRYPFLLVDRILKIEGEEKIVGLKNVTMNEPFFQGHFPGHPIMPGVLQLEAMAQVSGILMLRAGENVGKGKVAYFMSANNVKWRKPVRPGDQLIIEVEMGRARGKIAKAKGVCKVAGEVVSEAEVMFSVVDG
ncbi:MAG TPA: bifunctional UDP-3-O-[3-hydroxymyristoyl] N-acetylglucosamine deacetylase/3-hydroxyacyl-ACP dehydratase [Verrucomicrobiae bacterium]|nr:bifunctional UDP-3-O-[3-hydroxymyristoyl] N-acetylglucosamine deacetylase/3-hydroxyacyl-ACP dehydratase [Verrucomicrobiae bacterium]